MAASKSKRVKLRPGDIVVGWYMPPRPLPQKKKWQVCRFDGMSWGCKTFTVLAAGFANKAAADLVAADARDAAA